MYITRQSCDPKLFIACLLLFIASAEAVAAAKVAQEEMYTALLARRTTLVSDFERKAARYKEILIKEMVGTLSLESY